MGSKEVERQDEQRTLVSYTEDQPLAGTGRAKPGEQQGHGSELHNGPCFVEEQEGLALWGSIASCFFLIRTSHIPHLLLPLSLDTGRRQYLEVLFVPVHLRWKLRCYLVVPGTP